MRTPLFAWGPLGVSTRKLAWPIQVVFRHCPFGSAVAPQSGVRTGTSSAREVGMGTKLRLAPKRVLRSSMGVCCLNEDQGLMKEVGGESMWWEVLGGQEGSSISAVSEVIVVGCGIRFG